MQISYEITPDENASIVLYPCGTFFSSDEVGMSCVIYKARTNMVKFKKFFNKSNTILIGKEKIYEKLVKIAKAISDPSYFFSLDLENR